MFYDRRQAFIRSFLVAALLAAPVLLATPAEARPRNATVDVTTVAPGTTARRLVAGNYTVQFVKINPLRYSATLQVVPAATAAPTPAPTPSPTPTTPTRRGHGITKPTPTPTPTPADITLQNQYNLIVQQYGVVAGQVDEYLAACPSSWRNVYEQPFTGNTTAAGSPGTSSTSTSSAAPNPTPTPAPNNCSPPSPSTGSPTVLGELRAINSQQLPLLQFDIAAAQQMKNPPPTRDKLVQAATALHDALAPILATPELLSTELDSTGTCYSGGAGENDTITLTPVLAGITAPATITEKATIVCEPPLILSAGVVAGNFGSPTYLDNPPAGASPAPTSVQVTQVKPAVQSRTVAELHYRLCDIGDAASLFLTGIGAFASSSSASSSTSNFDGGLGVSLSDAEDHVFLTLGVLGTTIQLARPDEGPGQRVPANTNIVTEPVTGYRGLVGLSFRI